MVRQSPIRSEKRKALIIGISRYDHNNKFRNLDFCENDANDVYKVLKDQGYNIPQNALLVGRVEWSKMRDEIIKFFRDGRLRSEDTLFFYFSGHGYLDKNTGRTYLATSEIDPEWPDGRAIPFEELTSYINYSNSERIVAVLDCCYSGALEIGGKGGAEEGKEEEESAKAEAEKGEENASLANTNMQRTVDRLIKSGQGKCVLASSLEEQKSFKMEGQPYSTFTYFLIQGLKGAEGGSVDDDGYVIPESLGSYINKKMEELPKIKQKPIRKIEVTGLLILAYYPNLARRQQQTFQKTSQATRDREIELSTMLSHSIIRKGDVFGIYVDVRNISERPINLTALELIPPLGFTQSSEHKDKRSLSDRIREVKTGMSGVSPKSSKIESDWEKFESDWEKFLTNNLKPLTDSQPVTVQPTESHGVLFNLQAGRILGLRPRPDTYSISLRVVYTSDGITQRELSSLIHIRLFPTLAWMLAGTLLGSLLGTMIKNFSSHSLEYLLRILLINLAIGFVLSLILMRRKDVQPFITVEDFWGGVLLGSIVGFGAQELLEQVTGFRLGGSTTSTG
jgi:hypothetical protein